MNTANAVVTAIGAKMAKSLRPLGTVLIELEPLLTEMAKDHDLQWGDILNIVKGYMEVHLPDHREEYIDGKHPEFYYGYPR